MIGVGDDNDFALALIELVRRSQERLIGITPVDNDDDLILLNTRIAQILEGSEALGECVTGLIRTGGDDLIRRISFEQFEGCQEALLENRRWLAFVLGSTEYDDGVSCCGSTLRVLGGALDLKERNHHPDDEQDKRGNSELEEVLYPPSWSLGAPRWDLGLIYFDFGVVSFDLDVTYFAHVLKLTGVRAVSLCQLAWQTRWVTTNEPKRTYDVAAISQHEAYKLSTGLIVPRPIGWIGTINADGDRNLAPYSFFNIVAQYPPTFVVAPVLGSRKDTLANLQATREFTVNVVTEETVEAMNATAATFDATVDEFTETGLTAVDAETVGAPLVAEASANFECVVSQLIPVGKPSENQPGTGILVMGEATRIHVAERIVDDDFNVDQAELKAVGRHVGGLYSRTSGSLFSVDRPE